MHANPYLFFNNLKFSKLQVQIPLTSHLKGHHYDGFFHGQEAGNRSPTSGRSHGQPVEMPLMGKLLLAGTGHAHLSIIQSIPDLIARGHEVTAISPGERHFYSSMGPGMLGGIYKSEEISFPVREMVERRGGTFIRNKVVSIEAENRSVTLESGEKLFYDVLSCNLGSTIPRNIITKGSAGVFPVKPIENLFSARQFIIARAARQKVNVGICGGGPAAVEIAGNALAAGMERGGRGCRVQIFTQGHLLRTLPEKVRRLAETRLKKRGVEIFQGNIVQSIDTRLIRLKNGKAYAQDIIFLATGVHPPTIFADSNLEVGKDGALLVNRYLRTPRYPEIFGGGDCIWFTPRPLKKVGVYPVRQNPILRHNLLAKLERKPMQPFDPGGAYLVGLNLGGGYGIINKSFLTIGGRTAFFIKDRIDRKFMRKFRS